MSIYAKHFREEIIIPACSGLRPPDAAPKFRPSEVELLMLTAAQESNLGTYLRQVGGGPALGVFQMEPATHQDIWANYLKYRDDLVGNLKRTMQIQTYPPCPTRMIWDMRYAAAMCRLHYMRVREALPSANDVPSMARYWKEHYNTTKGKGTVEDAIISYHTYT